MDRKKATIGGAPVGLLYSIASPDFKPVPYPPLSAGPADRGASIQLDASPPISVGGQLDGAANDEPPACIGLYVTPRRTVQPDKCPLDRRALSDRRMSSRRARP